MTSDREVRGPDLSRAGARTRPEAPRPWAAGGTGRRARLRGVWGDPSGFESRAAHHVFATTSPGLSTGVRLPVAGPSSPGYSRPQVSGMGRCPVLVERDEELQALAALSTDVAQGLGAGGVA